MNIKKSILVVFLISMIGSFAMACSYMDNKISYKTISYKDINLFTLDMDSFINDIAYQINSVPENLMITKHIFRSNLIFDPNGVIKVLYFEFIDRSKGDKNVYTVQFDYLSNHSKNDRNLYIMQKQVDEDKDVTNVTLRSFLESIHRANWKEIIHDMEKSELYGIEINMGNLGEMTSFINTGYMKYFVSKTSETIKLRENEILNINGMAFNTWVGNFKLSPDGYEGSSSDVYVLFEIGD